MTSVRTTASVLAGAVLAGAFLAACGGPAAMNPKTAPKQIAHAYDVLFNFANPSVSAKVAVVEDGESLRKALTQGLSSPLARLATGAHVAKTSLLTKVACRQATVGSPCAKVDYAILGHQGTLFSGASGYAVYENGHWLVAKPTVCGLLSTMYTTLGKSGTPPGCA